MNPRIETLGRKVMKDFVKVGFESEINSLKNVSI
jgi:hypothetical protein